MSCYESESGTIDLPTSAVAKVKQAIRDANNALHEQTYAEAREIACTHGAVLRRRIKAGESAWHAISEIVPQASEPVAEALLESEGRAPKRADIRPLRATSRTNRLPVGFDAEISFEGRTVSWSVSENNHAVERARRHPVAIAFFAALDQVSWTRGSGGVIVGNDEYNRDSDGPGGGSNYITAAYGPKGERVAGFHRYR